MIDIPDQPEGSAISVLRGRRGVRLRWPRPGRLSGALGSICLGLALISFVVAAALGHQGTNRLNPWVAAPGVVFLFIGVVRYWWGPVSPSTLSLEAERLVFLRPGRLSVPLVSLEVRRHRGEIRSNPDLQERLLWKADCEAMRKRRRETLARDAITQVDDLGGWRGVGVSAATNTVWFGPGLGNADREWLVEVLRRWKDTTA